MAERRLERHAALDSRALAKTFYWKVLGVVMLFAVSYALTGSPVASGTIALAYHLLNTLAYYVYEKAWEELRPSARSLKISAASFLACTVLLAWLAFTCP
ncbi:hypothetical protein B6U99_04205 [Candidatus Geothermarchaeota archaeon ex4572_27]|nr:MAG: hypothetical protein B6U99_04205 [Candidatus Geothermarchaeota archaeon ex4572_27]